MSMRKTESETGRHSDSGILILWTVLHVAGLCELSFANSLSRWAFIRWAVWNPFQFQPAQNTWQLLYDIIFIPAGITHAHHRHSLWNVPVLTEVSTHLWRRTVCDTMSALPQVRAPRSKLAPTRELAAFSFFFTQRTGFSPVMGSRITPCR